MCGLVGFFRPEGLSAASRDGIIKAITATLAHRGPDDSGTWVDAVSGIALGHRRLSILDLSSAGHQPMSSASGRYVIVFNGEIYNHLQLRKELERLGSSPVWRGHSDTETLLYGFERWGIEPALKKTVGMFAFALWDRRQRVLTLARDRMGEKPLYYGWQGSEFLFGSELKALGAHPAFRAEVDRNALALYMRYGYIPAPHSIYRHIFKLPPGTIFQLSAEHGRGSSHEPKAYWSLREVAVQGLTDPFDGTDKDAIDELEARLREAVSLQSVADVPLGAFLSGGVDSTTVVALMQARSSRPVKTFTIGFREWGYNEAEHANAVAQHLGTEHTELYVTAREALEVIPRLPTLYDEPFGDSSAIPTFLVSSLARRHVAVSLSGDGGDEMFAGYTRYRRTQEIWRVMRQVPYFVRNAVSHGMRPLFRQGSSIGCRARRVARYLSARTAEECYDAQILQRDDIDDLVLGSQDAPHANARLTSILPRSSIYDQMMYMDTMSYLPDDILVKVDRASMGVGLEARVPMLDHRVVEFAWRLPLRMKVRGRENKWILKQVLRKYVPSAMTDRPKSGFGIPVVQWLRGPLRDWAEDLLSEDRLKDEGLLNPRRVREQWSRHCAGVQPGNDSLWQLLAFQAWFSYARPS
jgi:asparagine synthase (glutamine-hydrolysing)